MKTLSIIIVNFNTKEMLRDCLRSIWDAYSLELKTKQYGVLVVDNGSNDGSVDMIKNEFPGVKLLQNRKNLGFGAANNLAVKKSQGSYILFLNPDTKVEKNTLPYMLKFMEKQNEVGVATCKVILPDGTLDDACHRGFPTPWRALCHFSGLGNLFPHSQLFNGYHLGYRNLDKPHEIDACAGAFLLIRREIGAEVSWFDEDYFWYGEDLDLCYRVKQRNYKIMFVPDVSILHYKGAASGIKKHSAYLSKIDVQTKRKITRARFDVMRIFYKKHYAQIYPAWLTSLVFAGIGVKQKMTERGL